MITNDIAEQLQILRKLDSNIKKNSNRLLYLQELVENIDGCRAQRITDMPKANGPPKSITESVIISRENINYQIEKLKDNSRLLLLDFESVIESLQYKIRTKEWELLNDYYAKQFSNEKLEKHHGKRWRGKLDSIFQNYA
jgi:hypothetical protein